MTVIKWNSEQQGGVSVEELATKQSASVQPMENERVSHRVRHAKYGIGTVIQEDDTIIEVEFDGYGKKEFLKAFTQIERL